MMTCRWIAKSLLLVSACAIASAGLASPKVGKAPQARATLILRGFALLSGQTLELYPNEIDADSPDTSNCKSAGSDIPTFRKLRLLNRKWVTLRVQELGESYYNFYWGPPPAIKKIRGRQISMNCDDKNLYWVVSIESVGNH
jgi:hypothetical protein